MGTKSCAQGAFCNQTGASAENRIPQGKGPTCIAVISLFLQITPLSYTDPGKHRLDVKRVRYGSEKNLFLWKWIWKQMLLTPPLHTPLPLYPSHDLFHIIKQKEDGLVVCHHFIWRTEDPCFSFHFQEVCISKTTYCWLSGPQIFMNHNLSLRWAFW